MYTPTPSRNSRHDLSALNTARELYQTYLRIHASNAKEPYGVVLHRTSHKGSLAFREAPALLPEEDFFSSQQLQGAAHH
jgi:hypothetical protein